MVNRLDFFYFFFNDTATTEIYTLSLHDALPIYEPLELPGHPVLVARNDVQVGPPALASPALGERDPRRLGVHDRLVDRKSTRLNSSHANISYAVFCLKKKKQEHNVVIRAVLAVP